MIRSISAFALILAVLEATLAASPPPAPQARPSAQTRTTPQPRASGRGRPSPGAGAPPNGAATQFDLGVWTVHANSLDANFKTGDFSTPSKVVMTRTGGDVTADKANGNYKKKVLYLNGHVVMHDSQGSGVGSLEGGPQPPAQSPSTLTADKAQIDGEAKVYKAIGNVHYVQGDTVVTADNGTLNDETHQLQLEGSVHIVEGTRSMKAQRVVYNTTSGTAHAQGDVTMQFPGELHRHLATPKPLKAPKNPLTQPVEAPSSSP
jgi:lipopolysaccharide assembly outer membrane protein LptD (OstA)